MTWEVHRYVPDSGWDRLEGKPYHYMSHALDRVRREADWDQKFLGKEAKWQYSLLDIETGQRIML